MGNAAAVLLTDKAVDAVLADPAAEQLYDELVARAWAIGLFIPDARFELSDGNRTRLARVAVNAVDAMRDRDDTLDVAGHAVTRLLWPSSNPPPMNDLWWRTPLGRLLRGRASVRRQLEIGMVERVADP